MTKLTLEIEMENAAFEDEYAAASELARILRHLAYQAEDGALWNGVTRINDINGNCIGSATVE